MKVIKLLQKSAKDKMVKTAAGLLSTKPRKKCRQVIYINRKNHS